MTTLKSPGPGFKPYGVYHHHEYGGGIHLVWADHDPSEQEVVAALRSKVEASNLQLDLTHIRDLVE